MFEDRRDAGRRLAHELLHLRAQDPVVLGLPRGGVIVAAEVAAALDASLDVLVVRKLPAPHQPELAIGAVTDGVSPQSVLNEGIIRSIGVTRAYVDAAIVEQLDEVRRRQRRYRGDRAAIDVEGRTAIVVDDGIATGATVRAALSVVRRASPRRLVLAVPVAPPTTLEQMKPFVDEVVCLAAPAAFTAVGSYYRHFEQTTDDEVERVLKKKTD